MAWQLIYTSAPRLLEAGRTGFGTVARHRAISGMLASSVERFSQFARLPGHDPRRIVYAHRILSVGSGTFHVLSCLQDAGSDYTGRTNHIAHHLIAEPHETRALSTAGLTPADVLLAMAWRSSWNEVPRYFDPAEEVDLSSFPASPSHAWSAVTGNPGSAGILMSREAHKGCYLITPPGISSLELFRESLLKDPAQAWQTRFTTCLEPNDDVADFHWVALSSSSPMRGPVETSNRLVLDLTRPDTLPAPPPPQAATPAFGTLSAAAPEHAHSMQPKALEPMRLPGAGSAPVSTMGSWAPPPRRKGAKSSRSLIGLSLVIAAVMIVVVIGALLRQNNLNVQARTDYELQIAKTWRNYQLILNDTRKLLEEQSDMEEGTTLLKSYEDFFLGMHQVLQHPGPSIEIPLPAQTKDDLKDLKKLLDEWGALHRHPWEKLHSDQASVTALNILEAHRKWQDSRTAKWKQLGAYLSLKDIPPPGDDVVQSLKAIAREMLRQAEPARETHAHWVEVFKLPGAPQNSTDLEALQWLKLWMELDAADAKSNAAAQTAAANKSLPEWLVAKAAEVMRQHEKKHAPKMAQKVDDKPSQEVPKPVIQIEDADASSAKNPIHLFLLQSSEDQADKIAGLKVSPDMQLFVGTASEMHPPPDGKTEPKSGELKKWLSVSTDGREEIKFGPTLLANLADIIIFSKDGKLAAIPEELRKSPEGVRIVARSKDGVQVLFDLRLIPISKASSSPILTQPIESTVDNASTVTLSLPAGFLSRLHIVGHPEPVYVLSHDGPAPQKNSFTLKSTGDSAFQVIPPKVPGSPVQNRLGIEKEIKELEAGIAKDVADLAATESLKLSPSQKAARKEFYEKGKSTKELKLQELQAKLQTLEGTAPPLFDLLPGNYILLLDLPGKPELCQLKVVPPTGHSQSKPTTNP